MSDAFPLRPRPTALRFAARAAFLGLFAFLVPLATPAAAQIPKGFESAAAAFEAGQLPEAERQLREALARAPAEVFGLNLLAVTLDREEKYKEAEAFYRRALRRGRNVALLNNFANHYRATGEKEEARKYYLETLSLDPHHENANYQLAAMDVAEHEPREALKRIGALAAADVAQPAVLLLKGQALLQSGKTDEAKRALAPLEAGLETNASVAFSLGVLYYQEKLFGDAARAFEAALRQTPGDFDILYNLGLALDQQGQKGRAAEVLDRAARVNSHSADGLFHLAVVRGELGQDEAATDLLIRAREVAPERAEISLALAHECLKQQFWFDAADAYESYLRQKPEDSAARKELAFLYGQVKYYDQALAHLDRYVHEQPQDAEGFYLRGLVTWHLKRLDPASKDFRHALELNPRLAEAWSRLGEIAREKNDLGEAAHSFHRALEIQPRESNALYGLGLVLNTRGEYREALVPLRQAVEAHEDEPASHYQLSVAYRHLGEEKEARAEVEKFQQHREKSGGRKYFRTGLVAYLREGRNLSDAERQSREVAYLERAVAIRPGDAALRARLVSAYLVAGERDQAQESIRQWLETDSSGQAALKVGEILAARGEDERAAGYFRQAIEHPALHFAAVMDLAEAEFRLGHFDESVKLLGPLKPNAETAIEYQLLRAAVLDRLGRYNDALAAYQQAIQLGPREEGAYLELGDFFARHVAYDAALESFRAAEKVLPDSLRLALAEAIVLNLATRREEAYAKLQAIEGRWPEQDLPYILAGIAAYTGYRIEDARREFEKAAALESTNPLTYYYLALLESQSSQSNSSDALRWAELAVKGDPNFAQARFLLGRLYKTLGKNEEARQNLEEAIRLQPYLAEAHYLLGRVYAEMGDAARAEAETKESIRWHREVHAVSPEKENIQRLLVEIEPVRR